MQRKSQRFNRHYLFGCKTDTRQPEGANKRQRNYSVHQTEIKEAVPMAVGTVPAIQTEQSSFVPYAKIKVLHLIIRNSKIYSHENQNRCISCRHAVPCCCL